MFLLLASEPVTFKFSSLQSHPGGIKASRGCKTIIEAWAQHHGTEPKVTPTPAVSQWCLDMQPTIILSVITVNGRKM